MAMAVSGYQFGQKVAFLTTAPWLVTGDTYDADDRLASRWSSAMGTTYYTNDPAGNLTNVRYPFGTGVTLQYDALNRLTRDSELDIFRVGRGLHPG